MKYNELKRRVRVLNPSNGRCMRVALLDTPSRSEISWEIATDMIPYDLRYIGSEFYVKYLVLDVDVSDDIESVRELNKKIEILRI
jgi:hypothetical protein